ncbi:MAG: OstA-like protein [Flavobacteriaceae bacterium]
MKFSPNVLMFALALMINYCLLGQENKIIEIREAGGSKKNQQIYPGANILFKDSKKRVLLFHEGALIESDLAYFYSKDNYFKAIGNVIFTQGDTLKMTCRKIEYDGKTKIAKANGNVFFKRPDMSLSTEELKLNRITNQAFYKKKGIIVDSSSTLTSNKGRYFIEEKKYRFVSDVNISNPQYIVNSNQLDYYTELNKAYLFGESKIEGKNYIIKCKNGFYDLGNEKGFFKKNAILFYDNKIIKGDSLYFESQKEYAAATKNVSIFDSINNSVIKGHYAEFFKAKDSAVVTKNALSINLIERDTLYISADTLLATGPDDRRIIRAYYDVRILKNDMRGRSDSLHLDRSAGLTKLLSKPLTRKQEQIFTEVDRNKSNPVIWFNKSQMSGNKILLMSNKKTNKLDSLKISGSVLIIEKDTLSEESFNQIKGGLLDGSFRDGKLDNIIIKKNTEMIYYLYNDENYQLIGIDKTTCSALKMNFLDGEINDITFLVTPTGNVYPEEEIPLNDRTLKGFIWRDNERPNSVSDLFDSYEEEKN